MPAKALLHAAETVVEINNLSHMGIDAEIKGIDITKLYFWKDSVVVKFRKGIEMLMRTSAVDILKGEGRIACKGLFKVTSDEGNQEIECDNIIIASGSKPAKLPVVVVYDENVFLYFQKHIPVIE